MKQVNYLLFPFDSPEGLAMHAIGLDGRNHPYQRHGKLFYKPWRNRFSTSPGGPDYEVWENFKAQGLADSLRWSDCDDNQTHETFWLTRAGLDWLGERLGITILSMER